MIDPVFLDTNIIVYSFDKSVPEKNAKAKELIQNYFDNSAHRISTQVIQEFCNVALRKMDPPLSERDIKLFISAFPESQITIVDKNIILKALEIKATYRISFWDSLIIGAAMASNCTVLYSEDLHHGLVVESIKIQNPFM